MFGHIVSAAPSSTLIILAVSYCEQNLLFVHPDHLCFDRTTYDNINRPGGPLMFDIIGPAGPLMYPDQIFRDRTMPPCDCHVFK